MNKDIIEFRELLENINWPVTERTKDKIDSLFDVFSRINNTNSEFKIHLIVCKCLVEKISNF